MFLVNTLQADGEKPPPLFPGRRLLAIGLTLYRTRPESRPCSKSEFGRDAGGTIG
jgi:hypothetical protein